jgi:hypothetical protein
MDYPPIPWDGPHVYFDLDTEDTLAKENMTHGIVDKVTIHKSVGELQFKQPVRLSGHDDLTSLVTTVYSM